MSCIGASLASLASSSAQLARQQLIDWIDRAENPALGQSANSSSRSQMMRSWLDHLIARDDDAVRAWYPWQVTSRYCQRLGLVELAARAPNTAADAWP